VKQLHHKMQLKTNGRAMLEITDAVAEVVRESGVESGICVVFCCHTSCSLMIQENADPSVQIDILNWLERMAPDGDARYVHNTEGPDDMAAHLRTVLSHTSETIPVNNGRMVLGTWQGIYLLEHRTSPHTRKIVVQVMGE
jgi:secondary thiamine-phosphate synthase enzyme